MKKSFTISYVKRFSKLSYMFFFLISIFASFTPGKQPYFEISEMTTHTPCTRDYWWTLDFANMPSFPRAELVTSLGAVGLAIIVPIMTKSMTSFPSGSVPVSHVPKFYSSVFHIAIIGKNSEMFAIHITKSVVLSSILNPAY